MEFNETSSSTNLGNVGLQNYTGSVGKLKYTMFVPKGTEILTKLLALTKATWTANQNAAMPNRWQLLPMVFNATPTQGEEVIEESDFGHSAHVADGKLDYLIDFEEISVYNKTQLMKLNNGQFDVFFITDKDKILTMSTDGTIIKPIEIDYFRILPETQNTGTTNARVQLKFRLKDIRQMNELQVIIDPVLDTAVPAVWYPSIELPATAVKDLILEPVSMAATSAVIKLRGYDGVPYSGAVKDDVYLRKTTVDGVAISLTSLTESGTTPGTYAVVYGAQTTGTYYWSLYTQPTATTEGVETPKNASFSATIP